MKTLITVMFFFEYLRIDRQNLKEIILILGGNKYYLYTQ